MTKEITFFYEGHVASKSNTRYAKSHAARSRRDAVKAYQLQIGQLALQAVAAEKRKGTKLPLTGPRLVKLYGFNQRADPDNWFKATLDAMEGVVYLKDDQVIEGYFKSYTAEEWKGTHGLLVVVRWL